MINVKLLISFLLFSSVLVAACGAPRQPSPESYARPQQNKQSQNINQQIIQETLSTSSSTSYLIGPGDLLDIKILQAPELNNQARVNAQNEISMNLLGNIYVGGLTAQTAQQKIRNLLQEEYMHDPHVVVSIMEFRSKRVAVIGSVTTPGTFELLGNGTLLDAIALAGGLTPTAADVAYVTRTDNSGKKEAVKIDLDQLLDEGRTDLNIGIQMGDVIYIPEGGLVYVEGAVVRPGSYSIDEGDTTVSQAITMAGGVASYADDSKIKLVRFLNGGGKEVIDLDLDDLHAGTQQDPFINEHDAIIVGSSAFKSLFYGLRISMFGFGAGYAPPSR